MAPCQRDQACCKAAACTAARRLRLLPPISLARPRPSPLSAGGATRGTGCRRCAAQAGPPADQGAHAAPGRAPLAPPCALGQPIRLAAPHPRQWRSRSFPVGGSEAVRGRLETWSGRRLAVLLADGSFVHPHGACCSPAAASMRTGCCCPQTSLCSSSSSPCCSNLVSTSPSLDAHIDRGLFDLVVGTADDLGPIHLHINGKCRWGLFAAALRCAAVAARRCLQAHAQSARAMPSALSLQLGGLLCMCQLL